MTTASATTEVRASRKTRIGVVVSDRMQKTRVVEVRWNTTHPEYHKVVRHKTKFYVHDESNESKKGDKVEIMETRPLSRLKRWRLIRVVESAS